MTTKTLSRNRRPTLTTHDPLITSALQCAGAEPFSDAWIEAQYWGKQILVERNQWSVNSYRERAKLRDVFQ